MKHLVIFISFLLFVPKIGFSQEQQKPQYTNYIFDPKANAKEDLQIALNRANNENKNVLIVVGGDWDYWSRFINEQLTTDSLVVAIVRSNYVYTKINFSPTNKNEEILDSLKCPKKEGYPEFIILDKDGHRVHQENPDVFRGPKYQTKMLIDFLNKWAPNYSK
jgi:hypothetical protein